MGSSILVKKSNISQQADGSCSEVKNLKSNYNNFEIVGRKSRCRSNWCPVCGKRSIHNLSKRLVTREWRNVRQTILTIDRELFKDAADAYDTISKGKEISAYIRRLRRSGVNVVKYDWALEWYSDGFPHWHVFIDVGLKGFRGKIGNTRLLKAWSHGIVIESYIRNSAHWQILTGYFGKNGYFGDSKKASQGRLPRWALDRVQKIRRFGGSVLDKEPSPAEVPPDLGRVLEWDESGIAMDYFEKMMWSDRKGSRKSMDDPRSNRDVIASCGDKTDILMIIDRGREIEVEGEVVCESQARLMDIGTARIEYKRFKKMSGEYIDRLGHVAVMDLKEWQRFYENFILGGEI